MKTFLITGAGTGIGRATCEVLAALPDVRLILIGRRAELLEETRSLLHNPGIHETASMDTRDRTAWQQLLQRDAIKNTELSGIFANAGAGGENHYGDERWDEILSVNLTGTYVTIMECMPLLQASNTEYRSIVITSSCLARFGVPNYTAYCTAKAGLLGLTKSLAVELASQRILVNAICPGWVDTDMARAGIQKLADRESLPYEKSFSQQMSYVPLNKITQPREIGDLVSFLLNNQTSITGQGIDINNGSYMH